MRLMCMSAEDRLRSCLLPVLEAADDVSRVGAVRLDYEGSDRLAVVRSALDKLLEGGS